jgi:hypothetical protein
MSKTRREAISDTPVLSRLGLPKYSGSVSRSLIKPVETTKGLLSLRKTTIVPRTTVRGDKVNSVTRATLNFYNGSDRAEAIVYANNISDVYPPLYIAQTSKTLFFEVHRSWHSLRAWSRCSDIGRETWVGILLRSLIEGPIFTDYLKKEQGRLIREAHRYNSEKSLKEATLRYEHTLNLYYLINWREECNDFDYQLIEPLEINDYYGQNFFDAIESFLDKLPEKFNPRVDPKEVLSTFSSSQSLNPQTLKSEKFYIARQRPWGRDFSTNFRAKRCIVPVGPGNYRDAILLPIDVYNSLRLADKEIIQLLEYHKYSGLTLKPSTQDTRIRRVCSPKGRRLFYLRDFKKNGLTMNRELLLRTAAIIEKKFPNCHFGFYKTFRSMDVYRDDLNAWISTKRGVGLGQECALFTFIQCIIVDCIKAYVTSHLKVKIDAVTFNDDIVISVTKLDDTSWEDIISLVEEFDDDICKHLGLVVNKDKSYWSEDSIFCEEYTNSRFKDKKGLRECAIASACSCLNIYHAKSLIASMGNFLTWSETEIEALRDVIDFWGFEFHEQEWLLPFELGGWISDYSNGLNTVLRELESLTPSLYNIACKAINAYNVPFKKYHYEPITVPAYENFSTLGQLYSISIHSKEWNPNDIYSRLPLEAIGATSKQVTDYYTFVNLSDREIFEKLNFAVRARQRAYLKSGLISRTELENKIIGSFSALAIPRSHVSEETSLYTEVDLLPEYWFVDFSRTVTNYLEFLSQKEVIGFEREDDFSYPSKLAISLLSQGYTEPQKWIPFFYVKDSKIDSRIFYYCSNIYLAISDYVLSFEKFPLRLENVLSVEKLYESKECLLNKLFFSPERMLELHRKGIRYKLAYSILLDIISEETESLNESVVDSLSSNLSTSSGIQREAECINICIGHLFKSEYLTKMAAERGFRSFLNPPCQLCLLLKEARLLTRSVLGQDDKERIVATQRIQFLRTEYFRIYSQDRFRGTQTVDCFDPHSGTLFESEEEFYVDALWGGGIT